MDAPPPRFDWHRFPPIGDGWLNDVTAWKGGLASVGQGFWLSDDASTWRQVDVPITGADTAGDINAVAAWRDGLVAVGWQTRKVAGTQDWVKDATFWFSADGTTWTVATGPEFELGAEGIHSPAAAVFADRDEPGTPNGGAAGTSADDATAASTVWQDRLFAVGVGSTGIVWTSSDGIYWRKAAELAGEYGAVLWTSADGEAWTYEPGLVGQG